MLELNNTYTLMQKGAYENGTSNHEEHNDNPDYWDILLGDLKQSAKWTNKSALDFACGKGRNVINLHKLVTWQTVDGVDISQVNINYCVETYKDYTSHWYCNNGIDLQDIQSNKYDFVMSTIALQHIPVYDIRRSLVEDILRVLKPGGLFSFQMGFGPDLSDSIGRPKAHYYENVLDARGTNSNHDVRIQNENEIVQDLVDIGFVDISTDVRPSYSDYGHPQWIYVKSYKP